MNKNPGTKGNINKMWGRKINYKGYTVMGWGLSKSQLDWYKKQLEKIKNGIIIEVGVYGGINLLNIADICKKYNIKIFGVDPWEKTNVVNGANINEKEKQFLNKNMINVRTNLQKIIKDLNYTNIKLIQKKSDDALDMFNDNSIDIIYIDGDHSYDAVVKDITNWKNKVKKGGILWGDDLGWETVRKAVDATIGLNNIKLLGSGKWYTIK